MKWFCSYQRWSQRADTLPAQSLDRWPFLSIRVDTCELVGNDRIDVTAMVNVCVLQDVDHVDGRRHILIDRDDALALLAISAFETTLVVGVEHLVLMCAGVKNELKNSQG